MNPAHQREEGEKERQTDSAKKAATIVWITSKRGKYLNPMINDIIIINNHNIIYKISSVRQPLKIQLLLYGRTHDLLRQARLHEFHFLQLEVVSPVFDMRVQKLLSFLPSN